MKATLTTVWIDAEERTRALDLESEGRTGDFAATRTRFETVAIVRSPRRADESALSNVQVEEAE